MVGVVRTDSGPFNIWYLVSSRQVHPGLSSSWKDFVAGPESLHWGHPRIGEQLHRAVSCQQNYVAETCLYHSIRPAHELRDSHCSRHLSRHRMPRKMGVIVEDMPKQQPAVPKTFAMQPRSNRDCDFLDALEVEEIDITVLRPSDICDPQVSWTLTSMSTCTHISPHPVAGGLAGKVCHNRAGDARREPHEEQIAHGVIRSRGQLRDLHGLSIAKLGPSAIDEFDRLRCLLG